MDYDETLTMADRHVLFKYGVKEIARANKLTASFMARPEIDEIGSSCHLHVSLWSATDGTRWECGTARSPEPLRHSSAGQVANALPLGLLFAPNVNSYKRFQPEMFAGCVMAVGRDNRTCAFRLVGESDQAFRLENRVPGADANPYLAYAGTIAAGLEGIASDRERCKVHSAADNVWVNANLSRMTQSMAESVKLFEDSKVAIEALGEAVHRHVTEFHKSELREFTSGTVTDWERVRYFSRA